MAVVASRYAHLFYTPNFGDGTLGSFPGGICPHILWEPFQRRSLSPTAALHSFAIVLSDVEGSAGPPICRLERRRKSAGLPSGPGQVALPTAWCPESHSSPDLPVLSSVGLTVALHYFIPPPARAHSNLFCDSILAGSIRRKVSLPVNPAGLKAPTSHEPNGPGTASTILVMG